MDCSGLKGRAHTLEVHLKRIGIMDLGEDAELNCSFIQYKGSLGLPFDGNISGWSCKSVLRPKSQIAQQRRKSYTTMIAVDTQKQVYTSIEGNQGPPPEPKDALPTNRENTGQLFSAWTGAFDQGRNTHKRRIGWQTSMTRQEKCKERQMPPHNTINLQGTAINHENILETTISVLKIVVDDENYSISMGKSRLKKTSDIILKARENLLKNMISIKKPNFIKLVPDSSRINLSFPGLGA